MPLTSCLHSSPPAFPAGPAVGTASAHRSTSLQRAPRTCHIVSGNPSSGMPPLGSVCSCARFWAGVSRASSASTRCSAGKAGSSHGKPGAVVPGGAGRDGGGTGGGVCVCVCGVCVCVCVWGGGGGGGRAGEGRRCAGGPRRAPRRLHCRQRRRRRRRRRRRWNTRGPLSEIRASVYLWDDQNEFPASNAAAHTFRPREQDMPGQTRQ